MAQARLRHVAVFCMDVPPALHLLGRAGLSDEFRRTEPIYTGEFHRAVHKDAPALRQQVQDGFDAVSPAEREAIERKWRGAPLASESSLLRWAGYALFAVGAVGLTLLLWNHSLRRRVGTRTRELAATLAALRETEDLYRNVVKASPDGITISDLDGRITYMSDRILEFLRLERPEQALGRNVAEFFQPAERERVLQAIGAVRQGTRRERMAYTMLRADGTTFLGEVSARLLLDSEGRPRGMIGVTRDISEWKAATDALQLHSAALEHSLNAFHILDGEGRFVYANRAYLTMWRYAELAEILATPQSAHSRRRGRAGADHGRAARRRRRRARVHRPPPGRVDVRGDDVESPVRGRGRPRTLHRHCAGRHAAQAARGGAAPLGGALPDAVRRHRRRPAADRRADAHPARQRQGGRDGRAAGRGDDRAQLPRIRPPRGARAPAVAAARAQCRRGREPAARARDPLPRRRRAHRLVPGVGRPRPGDRRARHLGARHHRPQGSRGVAAAGGGRLREHRRGGHDHRRSTARIVGVNPAFSEITGYTEEEVLGRSPAHAALGPARPRASTRRCGGACSTRETLAGRGLEPAQERRGSTPSGCRSASCATATATPRHYVGRVLRHQRAQAPRRSSSTWPTTTR